MYVKKILKKIGPELFDDLLKVQLADAKAQNLDKLQPKLEIIRKEKEFKDEVIAQGEPYNKAMLAITGSDLIDLGIPRGKEIGELLDHALTYVIHHPEFNEKEALLTYCKGYHDKKHGGVVLEGV